MLRRSSRDQVEGELEVTSVATYDVRNGHRILRISGRLCDRGDSGPIVTADVSFAMDEVSPEPGDRVPANWSRQDPQRARIRWRVPAWQTVALKERDARACALGIDPADLPRDGSVLNGLTGASAALYWATNAAPLPDGTAPVAAGEADRLLVHGEAGEATVVAIDFLHLAPDVDAPAGASLANLALRVRRADGTEYRAIARFGFRTPERRRQFGKVGAQIPVRLNAADPSRVALDRNRLPRLTEQG